MNYRLYIFLLIFIWGFSYKNYAQNSLYKDSLYIKNISIEGNKVTKEQVIKREFNENIAIGKYIHKKDIRNILDTLQNNLFNTFLFIKVDTDYRELEKNIIEIKIRLHEKWYIIPVPIFELVDRNLNEWIQNQKANLSRTRYGIGLYWRNFRGKNETIQLRALTGFESLYQLNYNIPFIVENKNSNYVFNFRYRFAQKKNIFYNTLYNKEIFIQGNTFLLKEQSVSMNLSYRKGIYNYISLLLSYDSKEVNDTIVKLNQNYFTENRNKQNQIHFGANYTKDRRNNRQYATKGYYLNINFLNSYILSPSDMIISYIQASFIKFFQWRKKLSTNHHIYTGFSLPLEIPYINLLKLGYNESYIRGYDLHVIQGNVYGLLKNTLNYQILNKTFYIKKFIPKQFAVIPLQIYLNFYFDIGFMYNKYPLKENLRLLNKPIWGYGIGIDIVTYYNITARLQYSLNRFTQLNQLGFSQLYFYYIIQL